jgi:hypothetical protein
MRAAYCLSKAGAIRPVGRAGRLIAYEVEPAERSAADLPAGQ